MTSRGWVNELPAFETERYTGIDLNRLICYTLWTLQERSVYVTLEAIAVAAFRMFPGKFSMVDFPEYPDANRVNRALMQLGPKYRNWATGRATEGFVLTPLGIKVVEETRHLLEGEKGIERKPPLAKRTRDPREELARFRSHPLFKRYNEGDRSGLHALEVVDFLEAVPYTPPRVLRRYLELLKTTAQAADDAEMLEFLRWFERASAEHLRE